MSIYYLSKKFLHRVSKLIVSTFSTFQDETRTTIKFGRISICYTRKWSSARRDISNYLQPKSIHGFRLHRRFEEHSLTRLAYMCSRENQSQSISFELSQLHYSHFGQIVFPWGVRSASLLKDCSLFCGWGLQSFEVDVGMNPLKNRASEFIVIPLPPPRL